MNGVNYKKWTLHGLGVKVPSGGADIGIRVAAGGLIDGTCAQSDGTNNFACFELGSHNGASMIRGYSNAGTTDGSVTLFGGLADDLVRCGLGVRQRPRLVDVMRGDPEGRARFRHGRDEPDARVQPDRRP